MRKLNSVLFPIKYSEKFYSDIVHPDVEDFCQLSAWALVLHPHKPHLRCSAAVYYNDIPVGTMCCRVEEKDGQAKLYLMTLAVLAVSQSHIVISRMSTPIFPHLAALSFERHWISESATSYRRRGRAHEAEDHRDLPPRPGLERRRQKVLRTPWFQGSRTIRELL